MEHPVLLADTESPDSPLGSGVIDWDIKAASGDEPEAAILLIFFIKFGLVIEEENMVTNALQYIFNPFSQL